MRTTRILGFVGVSGVLALSVLFACGSTNGDTCGDGDASSQAACNPTGFVAPDGSIVLPDGAILLPDGAIVSPDGAVIGGPNGIVLPDGAVLLPDGAVVQPDGAPLSGACVPTTCQGKIYECGDCIDNDGDGKIDSADPQCLGPCDRSETLLDIANPSGASNDCKRDCYYNNGNGSGADGCLWDHSCDPHETAAENYSPRSELGAKCKYDPNQKFPQQKTCSDYANGQPQTCVDVCGPITPNGCDCFGCCTFPALAGVMDPTTGKTPKHVYLGSKAADGTLSCTLDAVNDPAKCHACVPVPSCYNVCGRCQLCIGKTSVPADCFMGPPDAGKTDSGSSTGGSDSGTGSVGTDGGGATDTCPQFLCFSGRQPCGIAGCNACPSGQFCNTGCCVPNPN